MEDNVAFGFVEQVVYEVNQVQRFAAMELAFVCDVSYLLPMRISFPLCFLTDPEFIIHIYHLKT